MKTILSALASVALVVSVCMVQPARSYGAEEENSYLGSSNKGCGACHSAVRKSWTAHGHSKMLRPVVDGEAPQGVELTLPAGKTWKDISYLVGGFSVYARFIDSKGYVVTGPKAQWSMVGKTLTPFMPDAAPGTVKYDCVKCHVVGWRETGPYTGGVTNALEGIPGVWYENSVGCEACHGPGHLHAGIQDKAAAKKLTGSEGLVVDTSAELCGKCHKRTENNTLRMAAKDLVQSQQQYTELELGRKGKQLKMTCVSCHNPHASSSSEAGFSKKCVDCHPGVTVKLAAMKNRACVDCHMPYADTGAYDSMVKSYHRGDMRSHIFGISVDPAYAIDSGKGTANVGSDGYVRLTVDMVCASCHKAGISHDMSRDTMIEMAKKVH
jgi:hypothetical protein